MKAEAENLRDGTGGDKNEIDSAYKMKKVYSVSIAFTFLIVIQPISCFASSAI